MGSRDFVVIGMCLGIILIGFTVARLSKRDRAMGVVGMVLGTVALIAYVAGSDAPPPDPAATPAVADRATPDTPASPDSGP